MEQVWSKQLEKVRFQNRREAGVQLARSCKKLLKKVDIVLALPRGGVPVAYEVAKACGCPMDVLVVRKIGLPGRPELAMGAIAEQDTVYLSRDWLLKFDISREDLEAVMEEESLELQRRISRYRRGRQLQDLQDRSVLLVDDGLATGATAWAAAEAVEKMKAREIYFAAPVCAADSQELLGIKVDGICCLVNSDDMRSVGQYYLDFGEVTDLEVLTYLEKARREFDENVRRS